jgi:DNA-binding response OmpR family regulator/HPt (histidine-containing phosphotransfer) domain-containing protein
MKILLVEDDEGLAEVLCKDLASRHYLVEVAADGQAGLELAEAFKYDLILLDFMLPKLDGISLCRRLRERGDRTPILLLTAYDSSTERVAGLDAGADDYIVKPCNFEELLARIRALLRRGNVNALPIIEWGNLSLDPSSCEVAYSGQLLHLTSKEYALMELFLRNNQRIFSQSALLDRLWSFDEPPLENTVRAHIKSLRKKLKQAGAEDLIETVYGLGYRLRVATSAVQNRGTVAATASDPQTQQVLPELLPIWERHREKYRDRIAILQNAVAALAEDRLDEALQLQAIQEAHTLIGSLGGFGFNEAAKISREIEQRFKTGLSRNQASELQAQVMKLQGILKQPLAVLQNSVPQPARNVSRNSLIMQQSRLLIVDDDEELTAALIFEATAWGMQAEAVTNLSAATEAIARTRPDIVLLDLCFPTSTQNGFELLTKLAALQPPVPVVVFTAQEDFADRIKVARLGGQFFLQKPVSPAAVMEAISQALEQSGTPEAKLLIVDDDPQMLDFLHTLLTPWGFHLTLVDDPRQFWDILRQTAPDLLILDIEMPEFSGIDLCQVVRNDPDWSELPILFLSAHTDSETMHRVFAAGGDDYVNKPILGPELVARVLNRLERTNALAKRTRMPLIKAIDS